MPHYEMPSVDIFCYPTGPIGTNAYLVICKKTKKAAVIDPAIDSFLKIQRECQKQQTEIEKIILTHSHWDHFADAAKFVKAQGCPILVHTDDAYNVKQPGLDKLSSWIEIEPIEPTQLLTDGDIIFIGETSWQVIHTPGHSPGGICLYSEREKTLFSGDTLFRGSIGKLDLPTGQPERMWPSLKKLSLMPADTHVFTGHGATTTIGAESWLSRAEEIFGG